MAIPAFGVIVGASLIAVGAGMALAAFRKPAQYMASGHLVGLSMGRQGSSPGSGHRSFVPRGNWAGYAPEPLIVVPEGQLNFVPAYPMAVQGEQLVPFGRV